MSTDTANIMDQQQFRLHRCTGVASLRRYSAPRALCAGLITILFLCNSVQRLMVSCILPKTEAHCIQKLCTVDINVLLTIAAENSSCMCSIRHPIQDFHKSNTEAFCFIVPDFNDLCFKRKYIYNTEEVDGIRLP